MRIAYMLTSLGIGGAERQTIALAERMAARGHDATLIVLRSRAAREWHTKLPVIRLEMSKSPGDLAAGLRRGSRFLRNLQPDVLHSHTFPANMTARVFRAIGAVPAVVSTIHNVCEGGKHRTLAYRLMDRFCLHSTAVSETVADRYVLNGAVPRSKCSVITNGIDLDEFRESFRKDGRARELMHAERDFVWLAAGRDVPAKDFDNLIAAFGRVRRDRPVTQLWIAGGVNDQRRASRIIASTPRESEGIYWLGHRDDMPEVLAAADAFVLSSAWEGLPLVVGEAMAMEKPVVATDVGGVRELVGDAGFLVPAKDSHALAEAMLRLMRITQEGRAAMGKAARLRVSRYFDMNAKAAEWEALYTRLLRDRR